MFYHDIWGRRNVLYTNLVFFAQTSSWWPFLIPCCSLLPIGTNRCPLYGLKFLMVSLPSFTSVFTTGKGETNLIQVSLGGGYPSAWQVSCIVADSIFETSDEGFLVKIGRPKRQRINMMWLKKAIVFTSLPIETTQNGHPLEEKYLREFSRVQYTPHV